MDLAAGSAAARCARGRCATVAVEAIRFESPVRVGDEVTVWAELLGIGKTSMKFKVSVWRRAGDGERTTKLTEAVFTFVALDSDGLLDRSELRTRSMSRTRPAKMEPERATGPRTGVVVHAEGPARVVIASSAI